MLESEMLDAAQSMEFERAATLRDQVRLLKERYGGPGAPVLSGAAPVEEAEGADAPAAATARAAVSPAPKPSKKIRRSELEEVLSNKKPAKRPGTPGVRANKRKKRQKFD
jgi:hypothetical protein